MTFSDAVIFDIDGTLWNATSANAKGWNLGLEELGMHQRVTARQIESVSGNTYEECMDMLLPGERINHPELLYVFTTHETAMVAADGGVFYDGVISGITRLAQDHRIFLVSNCPEWPKSTTSSCPVCVDSLKRRRRTKVTPKTVSKKDSQESFVIQALSEALLGGNFG